MPYWRGSSAPMSIGNLAAWIKSKLKRKPKPQPEPPKQ